MIQEKRSRASGRPHRSLRTGSKVLAGGVAASMVFMSMGGANAAPSDDAEALGQVISSNLFRLDLLDVASSDAGFPTPGNAGPNSEAINLALLSALSLNLGSLQLPLITDGTAPGLLDLGQLGVLNSYAAAPSATQAAAGAGAVDQNGAIALDGDGGAPRGNAKINLTDLLTQAGLDPITSPVVSNLNLEIGALGSSAAKNAGVVSSEYVVADAKINIASPAVGTLITDVGDVVDGLGVTLNGVAGSNSPLLGTVEGILNSLNLAGIGLSNVVIGLDGADDALNGVKTNLITKSVSDSKGIANINLGTGIVSIDLAKAFDATNGLNGQQPNTDVIDADTLMAITAALGQATDVLTSTVTQEIKEALNSIRLVVTAKVEAGIVGGTATINASIGELLGTAVTTPTVNVDLTGLGSGLLESTLTAALNTVALPLIKTAVGSALNPVLNSVGTLVAGAVTPLLTGLAPVINNILANVVQITVNDQPVREAVLGANSFSVSALTLTLLPEAEAAKVSLATSTVRALDASAATVVVDPASVVAGSSTSVTGGNWVPNAEITVQLVDGSGANVGNPVTVTPGADGLLDFELPVAAGTDAGDYTVKASNSTQSAEADLVVTAAASAATVVVDPASVVAGSSTSVTGGNWVPNAEITVQLVDGSGANVGNPVTVTPGADGLLDVELPVAAGTDAGDYTVKASNSTQSAEADLVVTADNAAVNGADNAAVNGADNGTDNAAVNGTDNEAVNGTDNEAVNGTDNGADNAAVNGADNEAVNGTDNAAVNGTDNGADNGAVNGTDNAAVNGADNEAVNGTDNGADNGAVNGADNEAVNGADNEAVNGTDNGTDNAAVNGADNEAVNGADNGTDNAAVNGADNGAVNGTDNGADNGAVNGTDNAAVNGADNGAVNGADNEAVNGADNEAVNGTDNGAVNGTDNAAVNGADNAAVNGADNAAVNGADNEAVNGADNEAVNGTDNAAVNGTDNGADNGAVNGTDNGADNGAVNGTDNGADNGAVNGTDNGADNGAVNGTDNAAVNGADNGTDNGADNAAVNGTDNGAVNGADNAAVNGTDNGADNGAVNGTDNAAVNGTDNGAVNGTDNGTDNGAVNGTDNGTDNGSDNALDPTFELVPGVVTVGEDSVVIGDGYTPNGTVTVKIKDAATGVVTELTTEHVVGEDGSIEYSIETSDLAPGKHEVTVVDNSTGKSTSEYLVVNAPALPQVKVDVTPKFVVQGESTLLTGEKFSANETATVEIASIGKDAETVAAFALSGPTVLTANQAIKNDGTFALRVDSTNLEVGDYQLLVTDNKTGAADSATFTVTLAGQNPDDNAAANTEVNTATNVATNATVNTAADASGDNDLANTGAQSLGLIIGAGALLLLGAAALLLVRKRKLA